MKLNLKKDIVFFDLETTGLDKKKDRIVQIATIKLFADGSEIDKRQRLINPEMPISEESTQIHGITDEDVKECPTFKQIALSLYNLIGDADLAGFNSDNFDIPVLMEEFKRAGLSFTMDNRVSIDMCRLYRKMQPHTLGEACKFYCGRNMKDAHEAMADIETTLDVLEAQLDMYKNTDYTDKTGKIIKNPIKNDVESIYEFTKDNRIDLAGKIIYNKDGIPVFNFGDVCYGKPVIDNPGFYKWMRTKSTFPIDTMDKIQAIFDGKIGNRIITEEKS